MPVRALGAEVRLLTPVLDQSPIGIAVFDRELRFLYINHRLARMNGRVVAEHLGRTLGELFPADHVAVTEPGIREVLATGDAQYDVALNADVDGVNRHYLVNRYPVRGSGGVLLGCAVTVQDVTAQRRVAGLEAEAARLRDTAELVRRLEESQRIAGFGSWEYHLGTGEVTWSRQLCAILAVDRSPRTLDDVMAHVHPDDTHIVAHHLRRLVDEGQPYSTEHRMLRGDGRTITVLSSGAPILDAAGGIAGLWGTTTDVTAQREVELAARQAQQSAELSRAAFEAEHVALRMFQRAMLPASVPRVPGTDLAVAYQPVADRVDIGGDWYDAFVLPDGRLALAVGDVTGHDLRAATVMGRIRTSVRAYAWEDPRPGSVLRRVNSLMTGFDEMDVVSMLYGIYDPGAHTVTWASAGHPPPLLRRADGATVLSEPRGIILGCRNGGRPYREGTLVLAAGDDLLWYTDGLVERRGEDIMPAIQRLCGLLAERGPTAADAQTLVADLAAAMVPDGAQEDDICVLLLRRRADG
jgi:PAS domain S-box-containing protein